MNVSENNIAVAQEIARQIGGRAFFMMGSKRRLAEENALSFDVRGAAHRINRVKVVLDPSDTYTVEFWRAPVSASAIMNGKVAVLVDSHEDVYVENLHEVISRVTGLALSL